MAALAEDIHFNIITPLIPTHYSNDNNRRPDILNIALMKGVSLKLNCIEPLQCLNSDHRPVLKRLGSLTGDYPTSVNTITNWQKVPTVLEEIDTPILNSIPNDVISTDDIDNAIDGLTNHIRTVVHDSSRTVPTNSDRKELPRDVKKLIRAQNAALRRASKYPTCENRSHARALQRKVRDRMQEEIEEEDRRRVSLPPKDDLNPITQDKYISNRHFTVPLDNTQSSVRPIRAGVPQGSTISTLLYFAYVNNIPQPKIDIQLALFADDSTLFLRPVITKASPIFAHAQPDRLYDLKMVQSKFCRRAADIPWYIKNSVLHRDLELPIISKFMKDTSERFFDVSSSHPNLLLVSAVLYEPPLPHQLCKRPRNVLIDPSDDLTVEMEKLLDLNKMAID
ncbi:Probable RNA-directed DNA polymerase from transposon X-element [Eumeta japonica]|uniref:Probable RNA-directed DNA polymerase from transposon X-element n=1 Tax=Eumeta variegata TaxID=151549 RepID=A0A4C1SZS8_EUMVA|nr:Probable RNA-directed DNA polymerase from transposon X-element [Eumeta japonica]